MIATENTRARNNQLRREARTRQQEAMDLLCELMHFDTIDKLQARYADCPSRKHINFEPRERL